ncbi:VWA domain-containing protein [Seongchinamella sediminis]|uniref:VWA domain-containing protein n=1 Tax=Seongchinamella sediminis TaxID=2283635 RepID=A0A3L7E0Q2_9GAMM|nr:VWA domain-containing protein [Seongchinamella sediminis]RLQ21821.1 VWA domain-containing protein [Seongchinamella sediminis]
MVELAFPWALLLLPLPLLMRLLPAYKESRDSVMVPFFEKLVELSEQRPEQGARILRRDRMQKTLVLLTWLCLVLAASKPQWIGPPVEQQKSGRDLMVAVDLSGSMETRDFSRPDGDSIDRLEAVKLVLEDLAARRASDRLGLIVFGDAAYLQTPFTDDHQVWLQLLAETEIGMAGPSTVFGDAIGLAIKLFSESESSNRVLIMLTDGNDTGSTVPPIDAAKVAAASNIRIYTIAIGDPTTVGEDALDLATIGRVSEVAGGRSFQALDREQMRQAYLAIAELEPELYETVSFRPRQSLHWVPLVVVLVLYLLYHGYNAMLSLRARGASRAA